MNKRFNCNYDVKDLPDHLPKCLPKCENINSLDASLWFDKATKTFKARIGGEFFEKVIIDPEDTTLRVYRDKDLVYTFIYNPKLNEHFLKLPGHE